jgi:tetratricopeptide (TPR) repeat protein
MGELEPSILLCERSIDALRELLQMDCHSHTSVEAEEMTQKKTRGLDAWSAALMELAWCLHERGDVSRAEACYNDALQLTNRVALVQPDSRKYADRINSVSIRLSVVLSSYEMWEEAADLLQWVCEEAPDVSEVAPHRRHFFQRVACATSLLGSLRMQQGNAEAALVHFRRALVIQETLGDMLPGHIEVGIDLGETLVRVGQWNGQQGALGEAQGYYERAESVLQALLPEVPGNRSLRRVLRAVYRGQAEIAEAERRFDQADEAWELALGLATDERWPDPVTAEQLSQARDQYRLSRSVPVESESDHQAPDRPAVSQ